MSSSSAGLDAMSDDGLSQSPALSSSASVKARVKRKSPFHVPSSVPLEVREQWSGVQDESLLFDEVLTSHAYLLTSTSHYQYLPIPVPSSSAAPISPAALQAIREKSVDEEEDKEEGKADGADAPALPTTTAPSTSASAAPTTTSTSTASSSSSSSRVTATPAGGVGVALTDAQRLLVESGPPPPDLPDPSSLNPAISSASTASAELHSAVSLPPSLSSPSFPLSAIATALSSGPLVDLPRSLPSLAYLDLHQRREHVLRHLLLLTASAQKKVLEHSVKERREDSGGKKKRSTALTTGRTQSSPSSTSPSPSSSAGASPMLRLTILSLFPLIQSLSKQDPGLLSHLLSTLLSLLQSLPLLSLRHEAADCIASFRGLLQQMLSPPPTVPAGKEAGTTSQVNAGDALTALIGLALAEGKLRHILAALTVMLRLSPAVTASIRSTETPRLSIGPFLSQLAEYRVDRHLPLLEPASFLFSFHHYSPSLSLNRFASENPTPSSPPPPTSSSASSFGVDAPFLGSIASDGIFLYVLNELGLFSIGSGRGGSVQRHIYGQNRAFHAAIADRARQVVEEERVKDGTAQDLTSVVRPRTGEVRDREKDTEPRSGTLLFVSGRLFFASPNVDALKALLTAVGSGGPSPLTSLPTSSALVVEVDRASLEVMSRIPINHPRGALPLYSSTTTEGTHIYALYREHKQKQKHSPPPPPPPPPRPPPPLPLSRLPRLLPLPLLLSPPSLPPPTVWMCTQWRRVSCLSSVPSLWRTPRRLL